MRPLIYWARDRQATLRLARRSPTEVAGQVVTAAETVSFCFDLRTFVLTLGEGDEQRLVQLNEYGWEI